MAVPRPSIVLLAAYWIALAAATHYPTVPLPQEVTARDKVIHFAAFAVLAFLFWRALAPHRARSVWIAAAVLIPYAAVDEYTQRFVGRYTDLADWIANVAGIVCVLAIVEVRRRRATAATRNESPSAETPSS